MSVYITREMLGRAAHENRREKSNSIFGQMGRSLARRWQRHRAIAELEAMDNALLRDIGITRGEIRSAVNGVWERDSGLARAARMQETPGHRREPTQSRGQAAVSV